MVNTYLCHVLILHSISEMVSSLLVHQGLVLEVAGSGLHKMPFQCLAVHTSGRPRLGISATQCWICKQQTISDIYKYIIVSCYHTNLVRQLL